MDCTPGFILRITEQFELLLEAVLSTKKMLSASTPFGCGLAKLQKQMIKAPGSWRSGLPLGRIGVVQGHVGFFFWFRTTFAALFFGHETK